MISSRVNKEWLSMHQCIDENCPVHSSYKYKHVELQSAACITGSPNLSVNLKYTYDNVVSDADKLRIESDEPVDIKVDLLNEKKDGDTADLKQRTDALNEITQCYEDQTIGCNRSKSLRKPRQNYGDDAREIENATYDAQGNNRVYKTKTNVIKPRFLCTWLNNNVDINRFPFYRLSVYYGSQTKVKKDAAVYSSFVTSQIWTCHKYIGYAEDDNDNSTTIRDCRLTGSKASRSHETLSQDVDSLFKDIPAADDISDLKLKYGFLFNPDYIFRRNVQTNVEKCLRAQNEDFNTQKVVQYLNHNSYNEDGNNIYGATYGAYFVPHKEKKYLKNYIDQSLNVQSFEGIDTTQPSQVQQSALSCGYTANDYFICPADQSDDFIKHVPHSPSIDDPESTYVCNTNANSDITTTAHRGLASEYGVNAREYSNVTENTVPAKVMSNRDTSTVYWDYTDGSTNQYTETNKDTIGHFPSNGCVTYNSDDSSLPNSYLNNGYNVEDAFYQSPNRLSPYEIYQTGSPYHTSALNVSPLASSSAFSHYVSPSGHPTTPHSLYYITKRNRDPRLQANDYSDSRRSEEKTGGQRMIRPRDKARINNSSAENQTYSRDRHSRPVSGKRQNDNQRTDSIERRRKYQFHSEEEDPLQGVVDSPKTEWLSSSEPNSDSPNSEIFYHIDDDQNEEEKYVDDVMDLFYAENDYHENDASRNSDSPYINTRHLSRSPTRSRYGPRRSRSGRYPSHVKTRLRSRSRDHRFPRTATTVISRHYDSEHLRYPRSPDRSRKYRHNLEGSVPTKKGGNHNDHSKDHSKDHYKRKHERTDATHNESRYDRRKREKHDHKIKRSRPSSSPECGSSRLKDNFKREKTELSPISVRSSVSEVKKSSDVKRHSDRKRAKCTHKKKKHERTKHTRRR